MSKLVAVDVAILPPPDITARAIALSAALPAEESEGPRLDAERLPHITLTQQFIRAEELDAAFERIDGIVSSMRPIRIVATGAGNSGHTKRFSKRHVEQHGSFNVRTIEIEIGDGIRGFLRGTTEVPISAEPDPAVSIDHNIVRVGKFKCVCPRC